MYNNRRIQKLEEKINTPIVETKRLFDMGDILEIEAGGNNLKGAIVPVDDPRPSAAEVVAEFLREAGEIPATT